MKYLLPAFLLALTLNCNAFASGCENHAVMTYRNAEGAEKGLYISKSEIIKTPTWSPGSTEPALSISQAITHAQKWAVEKYNRYDRVEISGINLNQYHCGGETDHWYYIIDFTPIFDGNRMFGGGNSAAVLFDGTVIGTR